jgi:hypothetical protein
MDALTRKRLVRQWKRFSAVYEEALEQEDETRSGDSTGDVISEADLTIRLIRTRATYLSGLVEAGILNPYQSPPLDERLWETHPINAAADLYEE